MNLTEDIQTNNKQVFYDYLSYKKFFKVSFVNFQNKPYPIIKNIDKQGYPIIIAEPGSTFIIHMNVNDNTIDKDDVYASQLWIDEKQVRGIKTFKRAGRYQGFKKGNGVYNAFLFDKPKFSEEESMTMGNFNSSFSSIGKVHIQFYSTNKIKNLNKNLIKHPHHYSKHDDPIVPSNKKQVLYSLGVKEGMTFDTGFTHREYIKDRCRNKNFNFMYEYFPNYDEDIDDIFFKYTDYYGALSQGYISSNDIAYFSLIPYTSLNYDLCKNALLVIIDTYKNKDGFIPIDTLEKLFLQHTKHQLSKYYDGFSIWSLFSRPEYQNIFYIDQDNLQVRILLISNINEIEDTNDGTIIKYNNLNGVLKNDYDILNTEQILSKNEQKYISKQTKNYKRNKPIEEFFEDTMKIDKKYEVIDLIGD